MIYNRDLNPFLFQFIRFFFVFELVLALAILILIFRRKLYREVPWFTIVMIECVVSAPLMFLVWQFGTWAQYYDAAWCERGVGLVFDFMVILDIIRSLFVGYRSVRRILLTVLLAAGVLLLVIATFAGPMYYHQYFDTRVSAISRFILSVDRSLGILQVGLILVLFAFSSYAGLSWRNYLFGIPFGYGFYATARLAIVSLITTGPHSGLLIMIFSAVASMLTLTFWLAYFLLPDRVPAVKFKPAAAAELDRWNAALHEYLAN